MELRNSFGGDHMSMAIEEGHFSVVQLLIRNGFSPNTISTYGISVLSTAVMYNKFDIVKLLLQSGANPSRVDNYGCTDLIYVAERGMKNMTKILLQFGARTDIKNKYGKTAYDLSRDDQIKFLIVSFEKLKMLKRETNYISSIPNDVVNLISDFFE